MIPATVPTSSIVPSLTLSPTKNKLSPQCRRSWVWDSFHKHSSSESLIPHGGDLCACAQRLRGHVFSLWTLEVAGRPQSILAVG